MSNPFDLFNLAVRYKIDLSDLEARLRQSLSVVHPDRFVGKTDQERTIAAQYALKINEAYKILSDPLKRAAEILKIQGITVPGDHGQTVQSPALLMQVMAWREDLENAKTDHDLTSLESELSQRLGEIELAFDQPQLEKLDQVYLELVYITKILEEISYHPLRKLNAHSTR